MAKGVEDEEGAGDNTMDQSQIEEDGATHMTYEHLVSLCTPIAQPMASRKLTKHIYKIIRKAVAAELRKDCVAFGTQAVMRHLRRGTKGFVVLAGNISPIDLISHIPVFCEEKNTPYCFVPSQEDLGAAINTQPTACVFIQDHATINKYYESCEEQIKSMPLPIS